MLRLSCYTPIAAIIFFLQLQTVVCYCSSAIAASTTLVPCVHTVALRATLTLMLGPPLTAKLLCCNHFSIATICSQKKVILKEITGY